MKKAVWISFDISNEDDELSIKEWLDKKHSLECGKNLYFFQEDANVDYNTLFDQIAKDINENITVKGEIRVYAIVNNGRSPVGRFIIGKRNK